MFTLFINFLSFNIYLVMKLQSVVGQTIVSLHAWATALSKHKNSYLKSVLIITMFY